jgi:hypothetical protein
MRINMINNNERMKVFEGIKYEKLKYQEIEYYL